MPSKSSYLIRTYREVDAEAVSMLMRQLGYDVSRNEIPTRVSGIRKAGGEVFVAELCNGMVAGCVQALRDMRLASGELAELVSLVVDENSRKLGLGRLLINAVEKWSMEQGLGCLRIRSNNKRKEAIKFYVNSGFTLNKEQAILEKIFQLNRSKE